MKRTMAVLAVLAVLAVMAAGGFLVGPASNAGTRPGETAQGHSLWEKHRPTAVAAVRG
jgi:hypothetical protein